MMKTTSEWSTAAMMINCSLTFHCYICLMFSVSSSVSTGHLSPLRVPKLGVQHSKLNQPFKTTLKLSIVCVSSLPECLVFCTCIWLY